MSKPPPRAWQTEALLKWVENGHRGIVEVVTGGGKTFFALSCIEVFRPPTTLIVVPTAALLDQWWEETANFFNLALDEVHLVGGRGKVRSGTINIAILNTAAKLPEKGLPGPVFLIVDECHKAASPTFRNVLDVPKVASLGLSATPERPYDEGLSEILEPKLGSVIFRYDYRDAMRDRVIVPFVLRNVVFQLEDDRLAEYDKMTKAIAKAIRKYGHDAQETVSLLLRRARILNLSLNRVKLALRIVATNRGKRTLIFHEDIEACELIFSILADNGVKAGLYHSQLSLRKRAESLADYREGRTDVLVTCRALDEGFNVPETELGIIAASTATRRQRIQRLGRILRPSPGKNVAEVFTLVATNPEILRLKDEEGDLDGVARISWERA